MDDKRILAGLSVVRRRARASDISNGRLLLLARTVRLRRLADRPALGRSVVTPDQGRRIERAREVRRPTD
jgi:hypothetical protein